MKALLFTVLFFAVAAGGCAHKKVEVGIPVPPAIPALPPELAQPAEPLPPLTTRRADELFRQGLADDHQYQALRRRYNTLLEFYECVRRQDGKPCV